MEKFTEMSKGLIKHYGDEDNFLSKRIKEYIAFGKKLNDYTKFCLENTDNFCGCEEVF
ncbi:hypothetical protein ACFZWW_001644 [Campylobacter jejuni]|nr:hypothetical protein [Campylobacter jejuni]QYH11238.1 hypothetical protein A0056_005000 [Campylobacter jejuni]SUX00633.1 Uncharacterised protein [Campylobacter jejuni subsp. doylei]VTX81068.1 Uncharacterised protein [Campylobacter jejuni]